jgi:DNA polymerase-1
MEVETFVAHTTEELEYAYRSLSASANIGCDTETTGLNARTSRLLSVQFSDGKFSALVPFSEGVILGPLAALLESKAHTKIIHNAKFDLEFLSRAGYETRNVFDSMIAEKLITRGANQSVSLAETLYRYFAVDLDKSKRSVFSSKTWDGRWTTELVEYALSDVAYLVALKEQQQAWLERLGLIKEFRVKMAKLIISGTALQYLRQKG